MTVEEFKAKVEEYRSNLRGKSGKMVVFSEGGPIGMRLMDDVVRVLEEQERRIAALEAMTK